MKAEELLKQAEETLSELKLLMSSFSPDSKFAELMKQATTAAHKESKLYENMVAIRSALILIAVLVVIFGVATLALIWGLAS